MVKPQLGSIRDWLSCSPSSQNYHAPSTFPRHPPASSPKSTSSSLTPHSLHPSLHLMERPQTPMHKTFLQRIFPGTTLDSRHIRLALVLATLHTLTFTVLESLLLSKHSSQLAILTDHRTELAIALLRNQSQITADSVIRRSKALTFYYALFIVALWFQWILCVDAIRNRNTIQVIGLMGFHVMSLGYAVMQIIQAKGVFSSSLVVAQLQELVPAFHADATLPISVTILVLTTLSVLVWFYVTYKLYQEFGWQIFKKIGADLRMRRMYVVYQVFVTILKFDVFMLLAFSTQWLIMLVDQAETVGSSTYGDYSQVVIHSVVSVGGSVVMLIVAYWAVRTEKKWAMAVFILADLGSVGYFISKLIVMQPPYVTVGVQCIPGWPPESCDRYDGSRNFFTLFLTVDLILGVATAAIALKAMLNFGKGLLPHVDIRRKGKPGGWVNQAWADGDTPMYPLEQQGTKRWTID